MGKAIPRFWWDLRGSDIIVEGMKDYQTKPVIQAKIPAYGELFKGAKERAELLIRDLKAGRKTPNWEDI